VVPFFINTAVRFEDYHTKSEQNIVRIRRIFFFMVLNTLIIPILGVSTGVGVFNYFKENGVKTTSVFSSSLLLNSKQ
jgi:hypothetical protein